MSNEFFDNETRGFVADKLKLSGIQSMASGFADMANGYINYGALKTEAGNLQIQAESIELQAKQQANNLRRQFIGAVGDATYNAAARGVKVTSANLQDNIQRSSGELSEDIRKSNLNAQMKADNLRSQAKLMKRNAKTSLVSGFLKGISGVATGYSDYKKGSSIGEQGWNPKTSAPARKPMGR